MVVRSLQKWCIAKKILTKKKFSIISAPDILVDFLGCNYAYGKLLNQTSKA